MGEAKKIGFTPDFFGSSGVYNDLVHKLGGPVVNGLYAMHAQLQPYMDDTDDKVRFWATKYKTKFNEDPTVLSIYGYLFVDAFAKAAIKAGPKLSTESFIKAMDTMTIPPDIFGGTQSTFSPTKHFGTETSRMSQIQDGKWKVVSDYPGVPASSGTKR
jgi:branched-chain amino acid transport system substrate-binding protein